MLTSQSWSQMQSVSSDSHNQANKHIKSLHGQNYLPEYNNPCFRSLLEPMIIYQSDETKDAPQDRIENPSIRALASRNNQNLKQMSL